MKLPGSRLKLTPIQTYKKHMNMLLIDRDKIIITCLFKDFDRTTKMLYLALPVPLNVET